MLWFFVNNFAPVWDRAIILPLLCLPQWDESNDTPFDLERSRSKFDLRSRSGQVRVAKMHIWRCGRTSRVRWCQFHLSGSTRSKEIRRNVFLHRLIMGEVECWPDLRSRIRKIRDIRFVGTHACIQSWKFHVHRLTTAATAEPWMLDFEAWHALQNTPWTPP